MNSDLEPETKPKAEAHVQLLPLSDVQFQANLPFWDQPHAKQALADAFGSISLLRIVDPGL